MKRILIIFILVFSTAASAYDLARKYGIGASGSYAIPLFGNYVNEVANPDFGYGAHMRYHIDSFFGVELGVSRSNFSDTNIYLNNLNLLGFYRFGGSADITPLFGAGLGVTKIKYFYPGSSKLSLLARAGLEYAINRSLSFGAIGDYQYVSKFLGRMPSPAHILIPQMTLTWYFGVQ
ncbi:MAG: outer membrane beta-barrel protein [Bacteriovorax sp.]|nr:outer membrane beta-barrel protein [Bacteriovorax sp.]